MSSRHARFVPSVAENSGSYFLWTPARSARTWVIVSQNIVLGEPVRLVAVEVDPFDAVAIAAARRDHVHRRHRRPRLSWLLDSVCQQPMATCDKSVRDTVAGNRRKPVRSVAMNHHCGAYHCRTKLRIIDIISVCFLPLHTHAHTSKRQGN